MGLMVKSTGTPRILPPQQVHIGVCIAVYDLGTQISPQFGPNRKVLLIWELDSKMPDGMPFVISQQFTLSLHEKATLRAFLESWRGRAFTKQELDGFDIFTVLGAPCQLQVIHNVGNDGQTYANVKTVMPIPKGMKANTATTNDIRAFSLEDQEPGNPQIPEGTWEWIAKKIMSSPEYKDLLDPRPARNAPANGSPDQPGDVNYQAANTLDEDEDSIPF